MSEESRRAYAGNNTTEAAQTEKREREKFVHLMPDPLMDRFHGDNEFLSTNWR